MRVLDFLGENQVRTHSSLKTHSMPEEGFQSTANKRHHLSLWKPRLPGKLQMAEKPGK